MVLGWERRDLIAHLKACDAWPNLFDDPGDFIPEAGGKLRDFDVLIDSPHRLSKIHANRGDLDADFAGTGLTYLGILDFQYFSRSELMKTDDFATLDHSSRILSSYRRFDKCLYDGVS